jgi:TrmH family RNA methyltransferase
MIEKITSVQNAGVKRVMRLRGKKGRDAKNLTIVEGVRELRQAFQAGLRIPAVYFCREGIYWCPVEFIAELEAKGLKLYDTSCTVFDKIVYGDRTEGILGLVEPPERKLDGLKLQKDPLVVVLESVEKPGNLGAVLRTADGAGADALIVCDEKTDLFNPNVIRASLGTIFSVPTVSCSNQAALQFLRGQGIKIIAAVVGAQEEYFKKDLKAGCAIVLGSEQDGLSDFWMKNADEKVCIPMSGKVDSLNVSVSAAVLVYEVVRQRRSG